MTVTVRLKRRRGDRRKQWRSLVYNQMVSCCGISSCTVASMTLVGGLVVFALLLLGVVVVWIVTLRLLQDEAIHPSAQYDPAHYHHLRLAYDGSSGGNHEHVHKIPNHLIFTHRINLLTTWIGFRQLIPWGLLLLHDCVSLLFRIELLPQNLVRMMRKEILDTPLYRLRDNVRHSLSLHADSAWYFWTDQECLEHLHHYYSEQDANFLKTKYEQESGMIKGDLCRGLALYELGGLYMDVDLLCRTNVWSLIDTNTSFVTVWEYGSNEFFQAFIGVIPRHAIVRRYLDLFLLYYRGELGLRNLAMNEKKGVVLLRMAYDDIIEQQQKELQSNLIGKIQLWNETKYDASSFPTVEHPGGKQALCQFLVMTGDGKVPFWSHIPGSSRHCQVSRRKSLPSALKTKDITMKGPLT